MGFLPCFCDKVKENSFEVNGAKLFDFTDSSTGKVYKEPICKPYIQSIKDQMFIGTAFKKGIIAVNVIFKMFVIYVMSQVGFSTESS